MKDAHERFWPKVAFSDGCWDWTAAKSTNGYGVFGISVGPNTRFNVYARRWAYEALRGPIPDGLHIDHLCRNRVCVNPGHLEAVTPRENILRGTGTGARNATATHCIRGHEFTPDNTFRWNGGRQCKTCNYMYVRLYRTRRANEKAAARLTPAGAQ